MKELEVSLGTGKRACGCRGCGRVFTSLSGFDKHQRMRDGGSVCLDPLTVGLERKSSGRWGFPAAVVAGAD